MLGLVAGEPDLAGVISGSEVDFQDAAFSAGTVSFDDAAFSGGRVGFGAAAFSGGTVGFRDAKFSVGEVDFYGAVFSGGTISLDNVACAENLIHPGGSGYSVSAQAARASCTPEVRSLRQDDRLCCSN